jgi:hypothetical protein
MLTVITAEYFWVNLRAFHTWIVQHWSILLHVLSYGLLIIARQPFSGLGLNGFEITIEITEGFPSSPATELKRKPVSF